MLLFAFSCLIILLILFRNLVLCSIKIWDISNRYLFLTGCDTGFGNLLAKKLDSLGVKVIAGCLSEKGRKDLEGDVSTRLKTVLLDVTKNASVHNALKCVKDTVEEQGISHKLLHRILNKKTVYISTRSKKLKPVKQMHTAHITVKLEQIYTTVRLY